MRWIAALILMLLPAVSGACGPDSHCEVEGGYYLASEPPGWDGTSPLPIVVYFHGWNGSPEGTFRNKAMVNGVNRLASGLAAMTTASREGLLINKAVLAGIRRPWIRAIR